jgi:hypothetical protein
MLRGVSLVDVFNESCESPLPPPHAAKRPPIMLSTSVLQICFFIALSSNCLI